MNPGVIRSPDQLRFVVIQVLVVLSGLHVAYFTHLCAVFQPTRRKPPSRSGIISVLWALASVWRRRPKIAKQHLCTWLPWRPPPIIPPARQWDGDRAAFGAKNIIFLLINLRQGFPFHLAASRSSATSCLHLYLPPCRFSPPYLSERSPGQEPLKTPGDALHLLSSAWGIDLFGQFVAPCVRALMRSQAAKLFGELDRKEGVFFFPWKCRYLLFIFIPAAEGFFFRKWVTCGQEFCNQSQKYLFFSLCLSPCPIKLFFFFLPESSERDEGMMSLVDSHKPPIHRAPGLVTVHNLKCQQDD